MGARLFQLFGLRVFNVLAVDGEYPVSGDVRPCFVPAQLGIWFATGMQDGVLIERRVNCKVIMSHGIRCLSEYGTAR